MTLKLTVWELRGKSKIVPKVPWLQIIHLYNSTLTLCIWYYAQWLSLQVRLHSPGYFQRDVEQKLLQVTCLRSHITYCRLLVLHKMLQHFLWNIVNITEIQECCWAMWRVCCMSNAGRCIDHFAWHSLGGARVLHGKVVSFCIDIFIFVSMYHIVHKILQSTDILMYCFTPRKWFIRIYYFGLSPVTSQVNISHQLTLCVLSCSITANCASTNRLQPSFSLCLFVFLMRHHPTTPLHLPTECIYPILSTLPSSSCYHSSARALYRWWMAVLRWSLHRPQSQVWQEIRLQRWDWRIWVWLVLGVFLLQMVTSIMFSLCFALWALLFQKFLFCLHFHLDLLFQGREGVCPKS